ncbi:MAG: 50S ribosome-binding GTPase [Planctomycetes bacterium]|nr:50S ribosome-binding GTPase [Planctomycetota bacterium]
MKMVKGQTFIKDKTIASIVTPLGEGGIGKIIVSGADALSVVNTVFKGKGIDDLCEAVSHNLYYGHIHHRGERIDEVILNIIKKGDSFTGENVVEVNCHGGIRVLMRAYECLKSSGAEGVAWDSLLSQSFENDKMDFVQKEALQELVQARTKLGVKVLLDQYAGALLGAMKQGLEIIEGIRQFFSLRRDGGKSQDESVSSLANLIGDLLKTAPFGMALTTPQVLVILGKPNVGKSTLINAILGEERMLVHHEPGTTRDYVSEFISVEGIPFELVDTAGMRKTHDVLESMSIEMTQEQLLRADKVITVFDNSRNFDQEDEWILSALSFWQTTKSSGELQQKANAHAIIPLINKCDLPAKLDRARIESAFQPPICCISALNREGFGDLNKMLVQEFDTAYEPMKPVLFNKRQYRLLAKADALVKQEGYCLTAKNVSERTFQVLDELKNIFKTCLEGC